ncbi:unnamed protein product [Camellia sinensis]
MLGLFFRSMDKTLEYLRRDEMDVLDKSGPKIIRHKPITALLSPTELDPYIPLHTASEDLVYTGIRNCCEILEKGHSKSIGSFPVSILRPFSEDLDCSEFNILLKRMKHEKLKWDNSFNVRGISTHLQSPIWIFWLNDVLSTFAPILKKCGIKSEEDVQTALNVLSQHKKKNGQHSVVERAFERAKASLNE